MTNAKRIIAVLSVISAAGCAANAGDKTAYVQPISMSALHASIPASAGDGNVFEYSSPMSVPAAKAARVEATKPVKLAVRDGTVFEYY
jgi:hypothetical protein